MLFGSAFLSPSEMASPKRNCLATCPASLECHSLYRRTGHALESEVKADVIDHAHRPSIHDLGEGFLDTTHTIDPSWCLTLPLLSSSFDGRMPEPDTLMSCFPEYVVQTRRPVPNVVRLHQSRNLQIALDYQRR